MARNVNGKVESIDQSSKPFSFRERNGNGMTSKLSCSKKLPNAFLDRSRRERFL